MMVSTRRWGTPGLAGASCLLMAVACQDDSRAEGTTSNGSGPLCPDCVAEEPQVPASGSDGTSSKQLECCSAARSSVGLDDPRAVELGAEKFVSWLVRGYEGPFEWRRSWGSSRVSGFDDSTRLQLGVSVEGADVVDQEPLVEPSNPYLCESVSCNDYLDLQLQVTLGTADGAISGSGNAVASSKVDAERLSVEAALPIDRFSGTLELASMIDSPREGGVVVSMKVSEGATFGILTPWIAATPPKSAVDSPLSGYWPVPTCIRRGVPLDLDTSLSGLERSPRELLERIVSEMRTAAQAPATWNDGTSTAIGFEIVGDIEQACGTESAPGRPVYLTNPMRLQTSDGAFDAVYSAEFIINWTDDGRLNWSWNIETDVRDGGSFSELTERLNLEGASEVRLQARSAGEYGGLRVVGGEKGELVQNVLTWCAGDSCPAEIAY